MNTKYTGAYFDDPEIWSSDAWQQREDDQERARQAAEWLPEEVSSVIDVGCGNGIYTNLTEPKRYKVGLDRSSAALQHITAPRLLADASRLPFENDSFDACVCMEMLEHLPDSLYSSALHELERVARKFILVTVPYNEKLKYSTVICPDCGYAFHQYYHLRQYQSQDIKTVFGSRFELVRYTALAPIKREALPGVWNMIRVYRHRRGKNFPNKTVCPHCGYTSVDGEAAGKQASKAHTATFSLRQLWPKRTTYTWWMALYRKAVNR
jgi:SAM-dependent methyltransferase